MAQLVTRQEFVRRLLGQGRSISRRRSGSGLALRSTTKEWLADCARQSLKARAVQMAKRRLAAGGALIALK